MRQFYVVLMAICLSSPLFAQGQIGIGTLTPASTLDVHGNLTVGVPFSGNISAPKNGMIVAGRVGIGEAGPINLLHLNSDSSDAIVQYSLNDTFIQFITGIDETEGIFVMGQGNMLHPDSNQLYLTTAGNLGIGVTHPLDKLEVDGKIKTTNFRMTQGAVSGSILVSDVLGNASWVQPSTLFNGLWSTNGVDIYNVNSGNVGIGTVNPQSDLEIHSNSGNVGLRMSTPSYNFITGIDETEGIYFVGTDLHNTLMIDENNHVGITSIDTSVMLNVPGTIKADSIQLNTSAPAGYVLTSNGSGGYTPQIPTNISDGLVDLYSSFALALPLIYTDVMMDQQHIPTGSDYTHNLLSAEITVNEDGYYQVAYTVGFQTLISSSVSFDARLSHFTAGSYSPVSGSEVSGWFKDNSVKTTGTRTVILYMNAGDKIKVQAKANMLIAVDLFANGSGITITKVAN